MIKNYTQGEKQKTVDELQTAKQNLCFEIKRLIDVFIAENPNVDIDICINKVKTNMRIVSIEVTANVLL